MGGQTPQSVNTQSVSVIPALNLCVWEGMVREVKAAMRGHVGQLHGAKGCRESGSRDFHPATFL